MTEDKTADLLNHIEGAAIDVIEFVEGVNKDEFISDKKTQQAVIFSFMIMGEASTKIIEVNPDLVAVNENIPWSNMKGMRNRIAHGYFQLDLDIIWDTIENDLPNLVKEIGVVKAGLK